MVAIHLFTFFLIMLNNRSVYSFDCGQSFISPDQHANRMACASATDNSKMFCNPESCNGSPMCFDCTSQTGAVDSVHCSTYTFQDGANSCQDSDGVQYTCTGHCDGFSTCTHCDDSASDNINHDQNHNNDQIHNPQVPGSVQVNNLPHGNKNFPVINSANIDRYHSFNFYGLYSSLALTLVMIWCLSG